MGTPTRAMRTARPAVATAKPVPTTASAVIRCRNARSAHTAVIDTSPATSLGRFLAENGGASRLNVEKEVGGAGLVPAVGAGTRRAAVCRTRRRPVAGVVCTSDASSWVVAGGRGIEHLFARGDHRHDAARPSGTRCVDAVPRPFGPGYL